MLGLKRVSAVLLQKVPKAPAAALKTLENLEGPALWPRVWRKTLLNPKFVVNRGSPPPGSSIWVAGARSTGRRTAGRRGDSGRSCCSSSSTIIPESISHSRESSCQWLLSTLCIYLIISRSRGVGGERKALTAFIVERFPQAGRLK